MLGEAFYKQFKDEYELKCTDIDVNDKWLSYLDFRDLEAYQSLPEPSSPQDLPAVARADPSSPCAVRKALLRFAVACSPSLQPFVGTPSSFPSPSSGASVHVATSPLPA